MSARISLDEIKDRLAAQLVGFDRIGSSFDADFAEAYQKTYPQAWVLAQRTINATPTDYTSAGRRIYKIEVMVQALLRRNAEANFNREAEVNAEVAQVQSALDGWQHSAAREPFVLSVMRDGPVTGNTCAIDLVFVTTVATTTN